MSGTSVRETPSTVQYGSVNATQIVRLTWLVLIDAIRPDGAHGLHAVHDTDAPVWVLIGMLRAVLVDLEHRWAEADWIEHEETEDD